MSVDRACSGVARLFTGTRTSSRCSSNAASRRFFWTQFSGAANDNLFSLPSP